MTILGLLVVIVVLCCVRAYVPGMPVPLPLILTILIVVLAVVLLLVVLQAAGLLPPFLHTPALIR